MWTAVLGRYTLRCVGYTDANDPVAYADRTFYLWTSTPTGKAPDVAALEAEKTRLEAITKAGSGKSFGEVGSNFAQLKDVSHDLAVLESGTGSYVSTRCAVQPAVVGGAGRAVDESRYGLEGWELPGRAFMSRVAVPAADSTGESVGVLGREGGEGARWAAGGAEDRIGHGRRDALAQD
jgi:hypothetical protein